MFQQVNENINFIINHKSKLLLQVAILGTITMHEMQIYFLRNIFNFSVI